MKRTLALALASAATLSACKDMGLGVNIPVEEAATRPQSALVAAVHAPPATPMRALVIDGRRWVPAGFPMGLDDADVRPVGAADGMTVYARRWDRPPYDALFTPAPSGVAAVATTSLEAMVQPRRWVAYAPVNGRTGPVPGRPGD